MALRRNIATRLIHLSNSSSRRTYMASPETASHGFFRRILQRRAINQSSLTPSVTSFPEFMKFPVGDKLREKLAGMSIAGDRIRPPVGDACSMTVEDVRKFVRAAQVEKVKERIRSVKESTVSYSVFVQICAGEEGSQVQGLEFAKLLDETANVIVWGNVVFLRPEQVAKSMESLITESIAMPNDPRKKELERMEKQKAQIDKRAQTLVRRELYVGLGYLMAQTAGFMRLTFWELSWDVMEPICFFVTSLHFALAYVFFLRTSREPSFEGIFRRRFRTKQAQLMKIHKFDIHKYERLLKAFYPSKNLCSDSV